MTVKFSLKAAPTFKKSVALPVHGGESVAVTFEFKHRTKSELEAWGKDIQGMTDGEVLATYIVGWDLDDKCELASFEMLTQNYAGSGTVVTDAYIDEIKQARRKN